MDNDFRKFRRGLNYQSNEDLTKIVEEIEEILESRNRAFIEPYKQALIDKKFNNIDLFRFNRKKCDCTVVSITPGFNTFDYVFYDLNLYTVKLDLGPDISGIGRYWNMVLDSFLKQIEVEIHDGNTNTKNQ